MSTVSEVFDLIDNKKLSFYNFIHDENNGLESFLFDNDEEISAFNNGNYDNNATSSNGGKIKFLNILKEQEDLNFNNFLYFNEELENVEDVINNINVATSAQEAGALSTNTSTSNMKEECIPHINISDVPIENLVENGSLPTTPINEVEEDQLGISSSEKNLCYQYEDYTPSKSQKRKHFEDVDLDSSDDDILIFNAEEFEKVVMKANDPVYAMEYFRTLSSQIDKRKRLRRERASSDSTLFSPKSNVHPTENINDVMPRSTSTSVEPDESYISDKIFENNTNIAWSFENEIEKNKSFVEFEKTERMKIIEEIDTMFPPEVDSNWDDMVPLHLERINVSDSNPISTITISKTKLNKNQKRDRPPVILDYRYFKRNENYWKAITNHSFYKELIRNFNEVLEEKNITLLSSLQHLNFAMSVIQPNYAKLEYFEKFQNVDGWVYSLNKKCKNPTPAMRWCGQKLNFYEYSIIRRKPNVPKSIEGLCPYCPLSDGLNLDTVFRNLEKSSYLHHVTLNHGVFSSGYEIYPPILGSTKKGYVAICTQCSECIDISLSKESETFLTPYFRHCIDYHNKGKKRDRTEEEKIADKNFFATDKRTLIYEKKRILNMPSN